MHYKNGQTAKLGDLVIGVTHNSNHCLRLGVVEELMPKQGPCNVRLLVIGRATGLMIGSENGIESTRFFGGQIIRALIHRDNEAPAALEVAEDYADCKKLVTVVDAYKALNAIEEYSKYDSPYFAAPPLEF